MWKVSSGVNWSSELHNDVGFIILDVGYMYLFRPVQMLYCLYHILCSKLWILLV
jgi:phosphoglycerol transferase MdoB-like AlkP superfamily enzyme